MSDTLVTEEQLSSFVRVLRGLSDVNANIKLDRFINSDDLNNVIAIKDSLESRLRMSKTESEGSHYFISFEYNGAGFRGKSCSLIQSDIALTIEEMIDWIKRENDNEIDELVLLNIQHLTHEQYENLSNE